MRKTQKKQIEELLKQLEQAHSQIKEYIDQKSNQSAMELLQDCQSAGISIGTLVESTEAEGHPIVSQLEEYCELTYQIYENLSEGKEISANKMYKLLRQKLIKVSNSIRNDIPTRKEAVFLPYKASMWDSLESVWQAADADPDCDAYVIPIPYYDRNPDGSFGQMHYEADQYPDNVPITKYEEFDFDEHHPDMIFIHNPYDNMNLVTSVHPFFYSDNLKKFTDCLVYIPYFVVMGQMSKARALCPVYIHADYIVVQSEKARKDYDSRIPDEKFLPLGSPKFDSIIYKCQNPPEPPVAWKAKMAKKKVYFYNTSIGGMLRNTDAFLKKMEYVFDTFQGREDACLIWRPHPLLETSLNSMKRQYRPVYDRLKKKFVDENIGILDMTPDIESTIALSDVYVGDSSTSVIGLFGVSGKPIFVLNNYITSPKEDDWRGEKIKPVFDMLGNDRYQITQNNQLWFAKNDDFHYKFYMDLGTGYSGGVYYGKALEIKDRIYILPISARNLLVIKNKKIKKIDFQELYTGAGDFLGYWYNEKYIFLFPDLYPMLIRFNIETEEIIYVDGIQKFRVKNVNGERWLGGTCLYGNELVFASPVDSSFCFLDIDTLKARVLKSNSKSNLGTHAIIPDGEELWLLPLNGMAITCWNPKTGEVREYSDFPTDFKSIQWPYGYECSERPFGNIAFSRECGNENIVVSPYWGNMYLSLDRETGRMERWETPMHLSEHSKNGYFMSRSMGGFVISYPQRGKSDWRLWHEPDRQLYDINIDTKEYKKVSIEFDYDELKQHESGFMETSEWMSYCLEENAFNSLKDLLDGNVTGNAYDKERQIKEFAKINASTDGTCGKRIYDVVK